MPDARDTDLIFGELAVERGMVCQVDVDRAWDIQSRNAEAGLDIRLGEILVKLGLLSPRQVVDILALQDKALMQCPACGARYNVVGEDARCVECGEPLAGLLDATAVDVAGTLPPEGRVDSGDLPAAALTDLSPPPAQETILEIKVDALPVTEVEPPAVPRTLPEPAPAADSLVCDHPTLPGETPGGGGETGPGDRRIGPYRILEEIGRGGMGVVYKAFDPTLKRIVALKVLIGGQHASDDAIARFQREAESVAKLGNHPGIVPVYDMGTQDNLHYFVMAYVDGKSLTAMVRDGEVTPRRALLITQRMAEALHFAHTHDVLHRDVKPDNILVNRDGVPALTDFGLAKDTKDESRLTVSGTTMGTPSYMPPEQADGRLEDIDGRSDVYSLGASFYEMLTGSPPFTGQTYQNVIYKVLYEEVVPPGKANPAVSRDSATICLKAMEKDRDRRYASAGAMAEDIQRLLDGDAILARPASFLYRTSKRFRRHWPLYTVGLAAAVLLAAACIFFLVLKPALDRKEEMDADLAALDRALEARLAPEREAAALLGKAGEQYAAGSWDASIETCETLTRRFEHLQGSPFDHTPQVRHPGVLRRERYIPLFTAHLFPLAQTMALKARALAQKGDETAALDTWLLAYAQSRQSDDPEESAVTALALFQIGMRQMALNESDRAVETFRKFLRTFPDHELTDRTWYRLGEALWGTGRFPEARGAFDRVRAPGDLPAGPRADLSWYRTRCRHLSETTTCPRPGNRFTVGDVDGDGACELVAYGQDKVVFFRLAGSRFEYVHHIPWPEFIAGCGYPGGWCDYLRWSDRIDGKRNGLVGRLIAGGKPHILFLPIDATGRPDRVLACEIASFPSRISTVDLDGDGKREIIVCPTHRSHPMRVFGIRSSALKCLESIRMPSDCQSLLPADLKGDGRETLFFNLADFSNYQACRLRALPEGGHQVEPLSPYRFAGHLVAVTPGDGGVHYLWVFNRSNSDDLHVIRSLTEARYVLEPGFYRFKLGSEEAPVCFSDFIGARKYALGTSGYMKSEEMFALHTSLPGGDQVLGLVSEKPGRRWSLVRGPHGKDVNHIIVANFDDDEETEIVAVCGKTFFILGSGSERDVSHVDLLGQDAEQESLRDVKNPVLATAIDMAAMDWPRQALDLFRKARLEAGSAFEKRRAMLGEADCLGRVGEEEKALAVYRELIRTAAMGITEELTGITAILLRQGKWPEAQDILTSALAETPLPEETRRWAKATLERIVPMLRLNRGVDIIPAAEQDGSYICLEPLKARTLENGSFRMDADGAKVSAFGRLVEYDGGPFRLTARITFLRQNWTGHIRLGMQRIVSTREPSPVSYGFHVNSDPGFCTNVPVLKMRLWGSLGGKWSYKQFRSHPVAFPAPFEIAVEYIPSLEEVRLRILDADTGKALTHSQRVTRSLPAGKYCLYLGGSRESAPSIYETWLRVDEFKLWTGNVMTRPAAWEPEPGAARLLRAGAALVLGDEDRAIALAGEVDPSSPAFLTSVRIDHWTVGESSLPPPAAALLIRAVAHLRKEETRAFRSALAGALEASPLLALWALGRGTSLFTKEEGARLGPALRELLLEDKGRRFLAMIETVPSFSGAELRDFEGLPPSVLEAWQKSFRRAMDGKDRKEALLALYPFLSRCCHVPLVEWMFNGTEVESEIRRRCLLRDGREAMGRGDYADSLAIFETSLEEFPQDIEALNQAARLLYMVSDPKVRNPDRALMLARQAVAMARAEGSPHKPAMARFLYTLGNAHFARGDTAKAIDVMEEALARVPASNPGWKQPIGAALAKFRKALAKKGK